MADNTLIEWADATLNALAGCRKKSEECGNCYAINEAWRMAHNPNEKTRNKFLPVVSKRSGVANWTGEVTFTEEPLIAAIKKKKPTRYFVNSLSDLFYSKVKDEWIDQHFATFALCPQHTMMVLTKRPDRMLGYLQNQSANDGLINAMVDLLDVICPNADCEKTGHALGWTTVLPNVMLGCSVGNQKTADERRESMQQISKLGWTTFVSYEPAIGPVNWSGWEFIDQIISGGETGVKARPSHPDWHRKTRDFCQQNGIAYFLKQLGVFIPDRLGDPSKTVNVEGLRMTRTHKKKAGRILDGHTWNEMPEAASA